MVVSGGLGLPAPASAGGWRRIAVRIVTVLGVTILVVQTFTISAAGLIVASALLLGSPPWLVAGLAGIIGALSLWLSAIVMARAWAVEERLEQGLECDDLPWKVSFRLDRGSVLRRRAGGAPPGVLNPP